MTCKKDSVVLIILITTVNIAVELRIVSCASTFGATDDDYAAYDIVETAKSGDYGASHYYYGSGIDYDGPGPDYDANGDETNPGFDACIDFEYYTVTM